MRTKSFVCLAFIVALAATLAAPPAAAHNWSCWIQPNRTVYVRNTANYYSEANAAINEWNADTILSLPKVSYHTDISVYDGNYGATGWGGLASIESYSGCTILHGHAKVNYYYYYTSNGKRGVFCQEIGHLFGLDHSNDGGCMGGGYWYDINTYYHVVSHNINDIANKYAGVPYLTTGVELNDKHAGHDGGEPAVEGEPLVHATWYYRPETLAEALELAEVVVVAQVTGVHDAPDIVVPVKALENGEDRIPNQRIAFKVNRIIKGEIDRTFDLFHTGNESFVLAGDPPYEVGQRYVLFLMPREDGSYLVVSPEGRYQVTGEGLIPASEAGFAKNLEGSSVRSLLTDMGEIRRQR